MDAAKADSFSISSDSRVIEKRLYCTSIVWKIVWVQKRAGREDNPITSPTFQFCNKSWDLSVYSENRCGSDPLTIDSVELRCVDINSSSAFSVYINHCTVSDEKGSILKDIPYGIAVFCISRSENSNYIINSFEVKDAKSLIISFNMCSEENTKRLLQEITKEEKEGTLLRCDSKLSSDFEELFENRQHSDVTLKLGEKEFQAHKLVLSARSKVFAAMFEHDMKENQQGTVDLVQMEEDTVQDMLRYIYCGKIRELSLSEALNLYVAADRYDLPELRDTCRQVAVRRVSLNNVLDIAVIADIHDDEMLIRELKTFISANGEHIINTEEWKAMSSKNPVLGMKLFEWLFRGKNSQQVTDNKI